MPRPLASSCDCSVIVCAHNPDTRHLEKAITALRDQTRSPERWQLLLVDNRSEPALKASDWLAWHPNATLIREDELGLTSARLRGIRHATAEILVFVDVDNVLHPDYIEQALLLANKHPDLGVWSGQAHPDFEEDPPAWTRSYWEMLAIREFHEDSVMKTFDPALPLPNGAGMCVRRAVALAYASAADGNAWRRLLDRRGANLMSGGDTDLALLSIDRGFAVGQFAALQLRHLIPPQRLTKAYLLKLRESMAASQVILEQCRHETPSPPLLRRLARYFKHWFRLPTLERRMMLAVLRGEERGWRLLRHLRSDFDSSDSRG